MSAFDRSVSLALERASADGETNAVSTPLHDQFQTPLGGFIKRVLDVFLALAGLFAFLPLFLLVSLALKLTSPGPLFYGHRRVGFAGRSFKCWKFRTMHVDGDEVLARYLRDNPKARFEWEKTRKLRNDPRVTAFGQVLRTYSVDELPQILNVLRGDMSFVGPRPVVEDELVEYGKAADCYLATRPGITGLWQVSGRSDTGYDERVALDVSYVADWSLSRDLNVLARTVPAVLGARGSY